MAWKASDILSLGKRGCHLLHCCLFLWHFLDLYSWFSRRFAITRQKSPPWTRSHTSAAHLDGSLCRWHFAVSLRSFSYCRTTIGGLVARSVCPGSKGPTENGKMELEPESANKRNHCSVWARWQWAGFQMIRVSDQSWWGGIWGPVLRFCCQLPPPLSFFQFFPLFI